MRKLVPFLLIVATCLGACSQRRIVAVRETVDSLNEMAASYHYMQIDSVANLANRALQLAERANYTDGQAEALNHLMFERFQQMDFDEVVRLGEQVEALKPSELEMFICEVMQMKVDQRTSDNRSFFIHRSHALHKLHHLKKRAKNLPPHQNRRLTYGGSELHITASTYFYYVDQRERALDEIREATPYCQLPADTAQWLYYCYMRGSGGLAESVQPQDVTLEEFDYLLQCFTLARYSGYAFFEANSAQSLATMMADSVQRACLEDHRGEVLHYLTGIFGTERTAEEMAEWALDLFIEYDDLYQTACVLRTLGELAFGQHRYADAIDFYTKALECVNFHHDVYYVPDSVITPEQPEQLLTYDPEAGEESVERRWLKQEGVRTVPEWIAGIRQQLSVAYSAMNMKPVSDFNRNIYLDLLEVTREDAELESRAAELKAESRQLHRLLAVVAIAAAGVILLLVLLFRSWRKKGENQNKLFDEQVRELEAAKQQHSEFMAEEQERLQEKLEATAMRIRREKRQNVEKRAKMSLVHGIVPFLDRIIHEVNKMRRAGESNEHSLSYIRELIQPIAEYNDLLTEWIQVEQGQLSLQLTSFELEPIFASIRQSHFAYEQKGLSLEVQSTELAVKADKALTLFMLNTLADNARKFTPEGGTVTISAHEGESEEGRYVELAVQDTGCGLTDEDIELILNNKVYDATLIGQQTNQEKKGFGFGLMNCKGIIEKYRKTNPLFRVCLFGITSRVGEGSRFFFRLPRVLTTLLVAFLFQFPLAAAAGSPSHLSSEASQDSEPSVSPTELSSPSSESYPVIPPAAYELMDSVYYCNVQGRFVDALNFAELVIHQLNSMELEGKIQMRPLSAGDVEALWWQNHRELDYSLILALRNEIAVSALALNDWTLYRQNNSAYVRLYKLVSQDTTLEAFCQETERTQEYERLALFAVVLLLVVGIALAYFLWFKPLLMRRKANEITSEHYIEELRATQEAECQHQLDELEIIEDECRRRLYEEGRLHVQNQIIDNCLSTIKHETMYYPGRILQLAERQPVDLTTLNETACYYKEIFTLLSAQGDAQSAAISFRRSKLSFSELSRNLPARYTAKLRRLRSTNSLTNRPSFNSPSTVLSSNPPSSLLCEDHTEGELFSADSELLEVLFDELLDYEITLHSSGDFNLTLNATLDGRFIRFTLTNPAVTLTAEQLHNLFMPHRGGTPLLVVKQIIREHDTFMSHPGCRAQAEALPEGGHAIWFTLPRAN